MATSVMNEGEHINLPLLKTTVDKWATLARGDRMTHSYSTSQRKWKWTKTLFFHLLYLTTLDSYIILTSYGCKIDNQQFPLTLIENLLEMGARETGPECIPRGRPNPQANQQLVLKLGTLDCCQLKDCTCDVVCVQ
jgi:hypothetical protein